ncbi:hypothetical protein [Paramicrobacterium agarici]|uniref:hypothetical protein n=1 Tax=Paramicrobacterium agarici TaxID=630514 RepID=UPI000BF932A9|nr:hypothetical protein [Microbacterium agarici]
MSRQEWIGNHPSPLPKSQLQASEQSRTRSGSGTGSSDEGDACDVLARIDWVDDGDGWEQRAIREPVDRGARDGAAGVTDVSAEGDVLGYTVAAGDAPSVIGDRFCIDYDSVLHFNGFWVTGYGKKTAPGECLYLARDLNVTNPNT